MLNAAKLRSARCHVNSLFWLADFDSLALRLILKFEPEFDFVIILKNKNQTLCQDEEKVERVWVKGERRDTEKHWGIVSMVLPNQLFEDWLDEVESNEFLASFMKDFVQTIPT